MMNKIIDFANLTHEDVQLLLSAETGELIAAETLKLEEHLATCDQCADFASTVNLLKETQSIAYAQQSLTLQEKAEVVSKIDAQLVGTTLSTPESKRLNLLGSAAVALVAILIVGAFIFTLSQPQNSVDVVAENGGTSELDYDGWEMGIAFDVPDAWPVQQLLIDEIGGDGVVLLMGEETHDLNEIFPPPLEAGETFGFVLVDNPDFKWQGGNHEQLEQFHRAGMGEAGEYYEIESRRVLVTEAEASDGESGEKIYIYGGSLQVGGRFVRVNAFGRFESQDEAKTILMPMLREIVASTRPVDYTGWRQHHEPSVPYMLLHPQSNDPFVVNDNEEVVFTFDGAESAFRLFVDGLNQPISTDMTSETVEKRLATHLAEFGVVQLVTEFEGLGHRPGLLIHEYDLSESEDMTLLVGIFQSQDPDDGRIIDFSMAVSDAYLVEIRPVFEKMVRSFRWQDIPLIPTKTADEADGAVRLAVVQEFDMPDENSGSGLKINWVEINKTFFEAGEEIELAIEWQVVERPLEDYQLFVHLLDDEGQLAAQLDVEPIRYGKPTSTWPLWELMVGEHTLQIPDTPPTGEYQVKVGLYDLESGGRLRINGNDSLDFGKVVVGDFESTESETTVDASQRYDGWELGITFDIPTDFASGDEVSYQEWNSGRAIMMGQNFADRSARSPLLLTQGKMAGFMFVADREIDPAKPAAEQLKEFHTSRVGDGVSMELAGKQVVVSKREIMEGDLPMYEVDLSLIFNGRFVQLYGIGNFGGKDDSDPIVRNLVEILNSMEPVDYADWIDTNHPTGGVSFLRPNVIQQMRQLGNTTIYAEAESSSEPFLLYIDYEQVSSAEKTLPEQIDRFLADYGETMLVESLESPVGRSDILLRRYDFVQADDVTLLVGALKDPKVDFGRPFVVAGLYISQEHIDQYLPLFEKVLRSMRWQDGAVSLSSTEDGDSNQDDILSRLRNLEFSGVEELEPLNLASAQLQDGVFESDPLIIDGAVSHTSVVRVSLVESAYLSHDFDRDGVDDAIGLLKTTFGGTGGSTSYLVLAVDRDGTFVNTITLPIGLKTSEEKLFLNGDQMILEMVQLGPDDPQCCPSEKVHKTFVVQDGGLVEESAIGSP